MTNFARNFKKLLNDTLYTANNDKFSETALTLNFEYDKSNAVTTPAQIKAIFEEFVKTCESVHLDEDEDICSNVSSGSIIGVKTTK